MSLLYKPLESITADDLRALIDNQVRESLYIEYKTDIDKRDEKKKAQFLGSASAFANAFGGDILVGVTAVDALPAGLPGLDAATLDAEMLRIRQLIGTGVEPELLVHMRPIPVGGGRSILVIRVPRSWSVPHGVKQNGHFQFFLRHSNGRSPMTLFELRNSFTLRGSVTDHIRRFRSERLAALMAAQGPYQYWKKPTVVLHLVPFLSAMEPMSLDLSSIRDFNLLSPHKAENGYIQRGDVRYNVDGVLMYDPYLAWHSQFFRHGALEHATTHEFNEQESYLDAWALQVKLLIVVRRFSRLLENVGLAPPVSIMLTLLNAANCSLRTAQGDPFFHQSMSKHQIDREVAELPDLVVDDFSQPVEAMMRTMFDGLWQTAGERCCEFYDASGHWNIDASWLGPV